MVGGDVGVLFVLIKLWLRLVNKIGIVIGLGLKKYSEVKVTLEGNPVTVASYNKLKRSCKSGTIVMFVPN